MPAMQIRCGDLYADKAVEAFTACAVSDKKCVPQRVDQSAYPEPPPCALDEKFDLNNFQVRAHSDVLLSCRKRPRALECSAGTGHLIQLPVQCPAQCRLPAWQCRSASICQLACLRSCKRCGCCCSRLLGTLEVCVWALRSHSVCVPEGSSELLR